MELLLGRKQFDQSGAKNQCGTETAGALEKRDFFPLLVEFCETSPLPSMQGLE